MLDPDKDIAFPASVVEMLRGDLGQPPGGWPAALQTKVLKGETPITARPGSLLPRRPISPRELAKAEKAAARKLNEDELASYLMYPKVFTEFCRRRAQIRPGLGAADAGLFLRHAARATRARSRSNPARRWWCGCTTIGETDEEGQVRVFFELNGQPRVIKVPNRSAVAARPARRKAEDGNANHVAAPMPGSVSSIAVKPGQEVKAGDILLSIEAMKMETTISAPRDGVVKEVLVGPGTPVDAKDLLAVIG